MTDGVVMDGVVMDGVVMDGVPVVGFDVVRFTSSSHGLTTMIEVSDVTS